MNKRIFVIFGAFLIFWLVLLIKTFDISIIEHKNYEEQATKNMLRQEPIVPVRGQIVDRNKEPLATNTVGFNISLPPRLSLRSHLPILEKEIENILQFFPQFTKEELIKKYKQKDSPYNHEFIPVIEFVDHNLILQ